MPSTSSWEVERHCKEHVDGLGRPSRQPGNCQENTRHIRLCLCGSHRDRVNPPTWKSQLTTPFTCGSALQPGQEAKLRLREQVFAMNCWPRQTLRGIEKGQKQSNLQPPSPSPPGKGVQSEVDHIRIDTLGLLTIFIQPWSTP